MPANLLCTSREKKTNSSSPMDGDFGPCLDNLPFSRSCSILRGQPAPDLSPQLPLHPVRLPSQRLQDFPSFLPLPPGAFGPQHRGNPTVRRHPARVGRGERSWGCAAVGRGCRGSQAPGSIAKHLSQCLDTSCRVAMETPNLGCRAGVERSPETWEWWRTRVERGEGGCSSRM